MTKTRMTKYDRHAIRQAILEHKFIPVEAALLAEENALAIQARAKAYGDYLKVIDAAPAGAFAEEDDANLNVGGSRIRLRFGADYKITARVFSAHARDTMLALRDSDPLAVKIMGWAHRAEEARRARGDLQAKLTGTLGAFRTFDDLLAGWPEASTFITERWRISGEYVASVPAVTLQELSAALDLPPEEIAVAA